VVGYVFWKPGKPRSSFNENRSAKLQEAAEGQFMLGTIIFDLEARALLHQDATIELTRTEARVLHIFALAPNTIIERSRLQKEIWEDDGVIVGRSLDVFISKLRKKLELDPNIHITVVRGKGYKLEIGR
jgi:DNA-binding response OmpR family regulator